jgi:hypothetical protein
VIFGDPTTEVNASVVVDDTNSEFGGPYTIDDDMSWDYSRDFECSTDQSLYTDGYYMFTHPNTATLTGDTVSLDDSETVTVHCYAPVVTKTANPYFRRSFDWGISKVADQTSFEVGYGESVTIDYTIEVFLEGQTDDGFGVMGTITVENPHPTEAMEVGLSDAVDSYDAIITADADCDFDGTTLTIPKGSSATCDYDVDMGNNQPLNTEFSNIATATLGGGEFTGEAKFQFVEPTELVDEEVTVTDTNPEFADKYGTPVVSYDDTLPAIFTYSRTVTADEMECGTNEIPNTATFIAVDDDNDTGQTGSADEKVIIEVICGDSRLTPTNTECEQFAYDRDNPDYNLEALLYSGDPTITNVVPGAMFYWIEVIHTADEALEVAVNQETDFSKELTALDVKFYDDSCTRIIDVSFTLNGGDAVLTATWLAEGTYYMQVRYDPKSLEGEPVPVGGTETFLFDATINGVDSVIGDSLELMPK